MKISKGVRNRLSHRSCKWCNWVHQGNDRAKTNNFFFLPGVTSRCQDLTCFILSSNPTSFQLFIATCTLSFGLTISEDLAYYNLMERSWGKTSPPVQGAWGYGSISHNQKGALFYSLLWNPLCQPGHKGPCPFLSMTFAPILPPLFGNNAISLEKRVLPMFLPPKSKWDGTILSFQGPHSSHMSCLYVTYLDYPNALLASGSHLLEIFLKSNLISLCHCRWVHSGNYKPTNNLQLFRMFHTLPDSIRYIFIAGLGICHRTASQVELSNVN